MVSLDTARSVNAAVVKSRPITAVFVGGTSGIGEYTLRTLVAHHGKNGPGLRVYLVGRNANSAANIITYCSRLCPDGDFRFVKTTDLSLLSDVDSCCEELEEQERRAPQGGSARIDLLVMSHSDLSFEGRRETKEGLEKTLAFLYYSRMRFIHNLLPLLLASPDPGAHVLSIFGAGLEKLDLWHPNDLTLRQPGNFNVRTRGTHSTIMTTLFTERLVQDIKGKLSFTHVFPGLVVTPAFWSEGHPWWFKLVVTFLLPILRRTIAISAEETGERMLFFASSRYACAGGAVTAETSDQSTVEQGGQSLVIAMGTGGARGSGTYSCKYDGETNPVQDLYSKLRAQKTDQAVWKHTFEIFEQIEARKIYTG